MSKPDAATLLPSQAKMLLKHSLSGKLLKVYGVTYIVWSHQTILKCHLTGESFVASVAAVCLLLARSREQPENLNFGGASFSINLVRLITLPLILLLADHPDNLAVSCGQCDCFCLHHFLHHRLAH